MSCLLFIFILQTVDTDFALKIYIKARATPKVVAAFAERREFDKILIYSKQVREILHYAGIVLLLLISLLITLNLYISSFWVLTDSF